MIRNISRPVRVILFPFPSFFSSLLQIQSRKQALMTSTTENNSAPISSAAPAENSSAPSYAAVVAAGNDDVDSKFGFKRPEMYQSSLAGSVHPYQRHVFLCYKSHDSWPDRLEASVEDPLPQLLAAAFKARNKDMKVKTLLTICEGREDLELTDGDVLIFPEMIKYRGLKESDVDGFIDDVLVNGKPWAAGVQEVLSGSYVFVCAHNKRDRRCGVCGPILIEKFKEEIESKNLKSQVSVTACSHVGGHKYAGNMIIFSTNAEGEIAGHWFGYVTPDDVSDLLDRHIGKGEIIERIWRFAS
ncbi:OLC1v1011695C1 [Oldenlandia corymbosa var. corymbosa]|uniref:OLC1v1011695C1 n=1 Tax=Oldenlandia corymbosa var. corymbosa TaxID=529605 RepID=A0AAV1DUA4_OLDCO|nr:OLC1v1011695C1 [Oldenlandia corymbosa var. corymbosa]